MANAWGYFHNKREEMNDLGIEVDINRDFPFNRQDNQCYSGLGT